MITIHKYPINNLGKVILIIPNGGTVLCVQTQNGQGMLWAKVDTDQIPIIREFYVHGTGQELPPEAAFGKYIGTFQLGSLVWHVFEPAGV